MTSISSGPNSAFPRSRPAATRIDMSGGVPAVRALHASSPAKSRAATRAVAFSSCANAAAGVSTMAAAARWISALRLMRFAPVLGLLLIGLQGFRQFFRLFEILAGFELFDETVEKGERFGRAVD